MRNAVCCLALIGAAFGQSGGGIQGVISDDSGQFVAGARVFASPTAPGGRSYMAFSGPAGQYSFAQAPAGSYAICVQGPRHGSPQPGQSANALVGYLDTCHWSSPMQVSVAAGQVTANVNVRLVRGAAVHVRLNDPQQYLAKGAGVVLAGVVASSRFIPLTLISSDASGRSLELTIPFNTALRLELNSSRLQLTDVTGAALPSVTTSFPILQAAGQPDPSLTFNITGKRP